MDEALTLLSLLPVPIREAELEAALSAGSPALTQRLGDVEVPSDELDRPSFA